MLHEAVHVHGGWAAEVGLCLDVAQHGLLGVLVGVVLLHALRQELGDVAWNHFQEDATHHSV